MQISNPFHLSLAKNSVGRDIVIGDLHGMLGELDLLLNQLSFDATKDRVICCGDLVDRGPHSLHCLNLINEPWLYSVLGNHELLLMDCHLSQEGISNAINNGAGWYFQLEPEEMAEVRSMVKQIPVTIDFMSGDKKIGITHADTPDNLSWDDLIAFPPGPDRDKLIIFLTWSRRFSRKNLPSAHQAAAVEGVSRIYHGHNIHQKVINLKNRTLIDTGAHRSVDPHQLTAHVWRDGVVFGFGSRSGMTC